jgi:5-methylcytosine-specific restriction endonuclease McrA
MTRDEVFRRDQFRCVYCGQRFRAEELTVDHVEPRVRGGDRSGGNLVTACQRCNTAKGDRRVSEFLAESATARERFFRHAGYVWQRILRRTRNEIDPRS